MARFTALPVGQGDAFLLARADRTILVDGGRSRHSLASQVSAATAMIDVVVCTHADADHAEGLIGLLESSRVPVHEVWLPGRWSSRLADLCRDQMTFLRELHEDVCAEREAASLEQLGAEDDSQENLRTDWYPELVEEAYEHESDLEPDLLSASAHLLWNDMWPFVHGLSETKFRLWIEAVQTAARIRDLARAAHHHGARIRWFDFDEFKKKDVPSDGEAFLKPLNSVELTKGHALRKVGALRFLTLSVANRESLVFLAPETDCDSAVLFSADSDLARCCIPAPQRKLAVTAPHHGSNANSAAYSAVSDATENVIWVRSDGNYRNRPGEKFLERETRVCTLCRNGGASKQAVLLDDQPAGWALTAGVRVCQCK